jgi:hypothetical protein
MLSGVVGFWLAGAGLTSGSPEPMMSALALPELSPLAGLALAGLALAGLVLAAPAGCCPGAGASAVGAVAASSLAGPAAAPLAGSGGC